MAEGGQLVAVGTPRLGGSCESSAAHEELARGSELPDAYSLDVARCSTATFSAPEQGAGLTIFSEPIAGTALVQRPAVVPADAWPAIAAVPHRHNIQQAVASAVSPTTLPLDTV